MPALPEGARRWSGRREWPCVRIETGRREDIARRITQGTGGSLIAKENMLGRVISGSFNGEFLKGQVNIRLHR